MNEENQISYYAVIPATVRYDTNLKPAEKLLYAEITSLSNKYGYCFASNKYFANLYNVDPHTVSQWISHIEKSNYIHIELIKNEKKEIKERRIYIKDIPYVSKNTYPYVYNSTYPMYQNIQDNNKDINIDDLFSFIIENSNKIPNEFYNILTKLEFIYPKEILYIMPADKILVIKNIIYVLYDLYNSNFRFILPMIKREILTNLYFICEKNYTEDFLSYYKRAIINKYTHNST